jgi:hypothetical protein
LEEHVNYPEKLFFINRLNKEGFPMRLIEPRHQAWLMSFIKPNVRTKEVRTFTSDCYVNEGHVLYGAWVKPFGFDTKPKHLQVCIDGIDVINTSMRGLKQDEIKVFPIQRTGDRFHRKYLFLANRKLSLNETDAGIMCPNGTTFKVSMNCPSGMAEVGLYLGIYTTKGIEKFAITKIA